MRRIQTITPCPACQNRLFRKLFSKGGRNFWRCRCCGLEQQYPLPSAQALHAYYDQSYQAGMYQAFAAAAEMKWLTAERRVREVNPHARAGRWLDVGCANGVFVEHARQCGLDAHGIDVSATAVRAGRQRGLPIHCATVEEFAPDAPYDTVTAFDVLEHVRDPVAFLRAAHRLLVPGGILALTIPNQASLVRTVMGRRWYFYMPEEHLYYFNRANVDLLLARTGFAMRSCAATHKPLTWRYSLLQFAEYNPLLHSLLNPPSQLLPTRWVERPVALNIGEIMVIAQRVGGSADNTSVDQFSEPRLVAQSA